MKVTAQMLEAAAADWGSHASARAAEKSAGADFSMEIDEMPFVVETRSSGAVGAVASAVKQLQRHKRNRRDPNVILVVPFMSEAAGKLCRSEGFSWFDLSGNADISEPGLRIRVRGFSNRFSGPGRPSTAFTPQGSRIARAMLIDPDRHWGVRELAEDVDMLPGTVSKVLSTLRSDGYVVRDDRGNIPRDPEILLQAWIERYSFSQHNIQRLHTAVEGGVALTRTLAKRLCAEGVEHAFTGSAAAYFVEPVAAFRIVVVYALGDARSALADLGIRPVDEGENIWLVTPNDDGVLYAAESRDQGRVRTVCLPQMYVDLCDLPERSAEVAEVLKRRGLWSSTP